MRVDTPPGPQDVVSTAKALLFQDQAQRTTYVAIDAPKGGTYHLAAAPGSSPVATYRSAEARVAVHVAARTRRAGGGRRTLTYRGRNLGGGSIAFVEEGKGLRRVLGTTRRARGRLRFKPSPGAGGRRTIRAVITQSGLPQSSRRVATFSTGRIRPARPQRVRIRRGGASATVTWRGPRGASYRVLFTSSDGRRMRLAADPSRRTRRSLQIPAVPRASTIRVQVRRLAVAGGLSASSRATSRGRR